MSGSASTILFVVENDVQWDNAVAVGRELGPETRYLDLWATSVVNSRQPVPRHNAPLSISRMRAVASQLRAAESVRVVVLPQDMGLMQRLIASQARRLGLAVALMPDGVVAARTLGNGGLRHRAMRGAVHMGLRPFGYSAGIPGRMAGTDPDLILSWGPGWHGAFTAAPHAQIVDVGCPRMDQYAALGPPPGADRILVCSQPLFVPSATRPLAGRWYQFLSRCLEIGGDRVRLRLHPAERTSAEVPSALRAADGGRPLAEDLAWCDAVASPFSTTAVDALAARRAALLLEEPGAFQELIAAIPVFADSRLPRLGWDPAALFESATWQETATIEALAADYVSGVGSSSSQVAACLVELTKAGAT